MDKKKYNNNLLKVDCSKMELPIGIEPITKSLQNSRSTIWAMTAKLGQHRKPMESNRLSSTV